MPDFIPVKIQSKVLNIPVNDGQISDWYSQILAAKEDINNQRSRIQNNLAQIEVLNKQIVAYYIANYNGGVYPE